MSKPVTRALLMAFAMSISLAAAAQGSDSVRTVPAAPASLPNLRAFPSLAGATTWINSTALTPADLRGKVVLVDFWTYTCINWLRTLPYVRAWAGKYKDRGLVVIGVHTPEFEFEKNLDNVHRAVAGMNIPYPVAVDSNSEIWRAFDNKYWPALYFVDAKGQIRHHQFGEGDYDKAERVIQQLLVEAGASSVPKDLVAVSGQGVEAAPDWRNLKSPENYVGYERTEGFVSPGAPSLGKPRVYTLPARLELNQWALAGDWTIGKQAVALNKGHGRIVYRFHARDLHLVMGPATPATPVRLRVLVDGKAPAEAHGVDVDSQGSGTVDTPRMYQLIRQPGAIADRQIDIEFLDPGIEIFAFTFG